MLLTDVTARDGLQGLATVLSTERKLALIADLVAAGHRSLEVASFVNQRLVPTMADADELCRRLPRPDGVQYSAVILSPRDLDRALAADLDTIGIAVAPSDTFLTRNQRCDRAESLARAAAVERGRRGTRAGFLGYVSCCFACPFEGPMAPDEVAELCVRLLDLGADAVYLADTNGHGTPPKTRALLDQALARVPAERLGCHFHDTFGQAIANLDVALLAGIRRIDAASAGLGGCIFIPNAAGNVATEDVLRLLASHGIESGIDSVRAARVGAALCAELGLTNGSKAGRAWLAQASSA